jgi:hypothetical protein
MDDYESLSHTKWDCKYHVVFIPKCRRKTLWGRVSDPNSRFRAAQFLKPPALPGDTYSRTLSRPGSNVTGLANQDI